MTFMLNPSVEVRSRRTRSEWTHIHDDEEIIVRRPMTAQELLVELVSLLSRSCDRPRCNAARSEAATARGLRDQLERVTAERDALERLLTRRVTPGPPY